MSRFLQIQQVLVPQEFVDSVYGHFNEVGAQGFEGIALWAGVPSGSTFDVSHTIFPEQQLERSPLGLSYSVSAEELHRINVWLYQNKVQLIAQIHSHPSEAYHSETDDAYPIITTIGGLSLVIPDFGFSDKNFQNSACYRLMPGKGWCELSKEEKHSLIQIIS